MANVGTALRKPVIRCATLAVAAAAVAAVPATQPAWSTGTGDTIVVRWNRYGGIHFEQADLDGRHLGRWMGAEVWRLALRHFG